MLARLVAIVLGLAVLAVGGLGVASLRAPDAGAVVAARAALAGVLGSDAGAALLGGGVLSFGLLGGGLLLLLGGVLPRRRPATARAQGAAAPDARLVRKAKRQAASMARKGNLGEAAELCYHTGLLEEAAVYFEQGELFVRAAEIRQQQDRMQDAAALYVKAGQDETAARLFAELGEPERAAESYLKAGHQSMAAEMFEEAGQPLRAAEAYESVGFYRHSAQAFLHAKQWVRAARSLEQLFAEESVGQGGSPGKQKELRRIALQSGKLYEQAGDLESAARVLEKGGCWAAAGEVAQRLGQLARAAELYLEAHDPPRAAAALEQLGEHTAAARVLGEHAREQGDAAAAARHFLDAGEHLEAGDLFRRLEDYEHAGECYQQAGDRAQAAEVFELAGADARAAENYEAAQHWDEAAAAWERAGDPERQSIVLERAGHRLRAGRLHHERGATEEAIRVLQQVNADDPDFGKASALLGEIFHARGQHGLAIAKLRQAIGEGEITRESMDAWYQLAAVHEANDDLGDALSIYERILALDYQYRDVAQCLEALRERRRLSSQPPDASAPGPHVSRSGRYKIIGELGRGGMGIVYKAQDTVLDRPVAFKVLPETLKENPQALKNFLREAKSAAKLNHPNIVTVYDAGEQDGLYYIAMEYVDGTTLKEIVRRRGAIPTNGVLQVLVQMCEALDYAHSQRVVHRDIKSANTMWTRDKKAKIMDFGLAKVLEEVRNHTTMVSGTPYYMSPEQTLGRNVDHRTDLYSLGVALFELATGTLPFREGNVPYHHVHTPPPDPREANPEVPEFLAALISRCLRKRPSERFQTAGAMLAELRTHLGR